MERKERIVEAARSGTVRSLRRLLEEDAEILDSFSSSDWYPENPLHLVSTFGHLEFAMEYLQKLRSPASAVSLICQLNHKAYTSLHLASANGHLEMVRFLLDFMDELVERHNLEQVEEICLIKGGGGENALHSAVINGKDDVIALLLSRCSKAASDITNYNETVLHLALKHNHLEAFRLLIQGFIFDPDLLNLQDNHLGNTVLHLAAEKEDIQIIKELLGQQVHVNLKNHSKCTALDAIARPPTNFNTEYIVKLIESAGGRISGNLANQRVRDMNELRNGILVMASLFATVTFQVALTAPGGFWQDWGSANTTESESAVRHIPGTSILNDLPGTNFDFSYMLICNVVVFISSIATIIILLLPSYYFVRSPSIMGFLVSAALCNTTATFFLSTSLTTGGNWGARATSSSSFVFVMFIIWYYLRSLRRMVRE